jgi:hypothetical protein
MRDTPRPRRRVSSTTLRLLRPLYRFSAARDAYVLRFAGGQFGPVFVDKLVAPAEPRPEGARAEPTGRFTRGADAPKDEAPAAQTREP